MLCPEPLTTLRSRPQEIRAFGNSPRMQHASFRHKFDNFVRVQKPEVKIHIFESSKRKTLIKPAHLAKYVCSDRHITGPEISPGFVCRAFHIRPVPDAAGARSALEDIRSATLSSIRFQPARLGDAVIVQKHQPFAAG